MTGSRYEWLATPVALAEELKPKMTATTDHTVSQRALVTDAQLTLRHSLRINAACGRAPQITFTLDGNRG